MKFLKIILASVFLFAGSGCKKRNQTADDTLVIGIPAPPQTFDPRFSTDGVGGNMAGLLFSALVRMNDKMEIVPDMAESWTYKNGVYEFQLRPGLKFSNGAGVTAEDFLFSFSEFKKEACPFSTAYKNIKKVEAKYDEKERYVRLHLEQFSTATLSDLVILKILPKKTVEEFGKDFYNHIVGSGGFTIASSNDNEILLHARPDFHRPSHMKKVLFKIVRDDNSRFQRMYKGGLDVVQGDMPLSKISVFKTSNRFEVFAGPGLHVTYLLVNMRDPLLKNLPVRQALAMAIDRESIIKYKLEGYATPASTFVPPMSPFYDADLKLDEHDLEKAKALLSPYLKPGMTLELKTSNQSSAVENGKVLSHQFGQLGLDVKLKSFEWGTYYDDIKKGQFQLATMRFVGVLDPDLYRLAFHSGELPPVGKNRGFYINKQLDPLLAQGTHIEDQAQRIKHYKEIQATILKDLPAIPLWYDQYVTILNKKIKNYVFSPNNSFSFVFDVEKITAEKNKTGEQ